MLNIYVNFGFSIMKKLLDLAHENMANILSGHGIGVNIQGQKYSRLRCLLRVKGLVICFYLGWSGSILQFRQI